MEDKKSFTFRKAIAFDFLGVIAAHDGMPFTSEEKYLEQAPNKEVVDAMGILRSKGYKVIVHSTISTDLLEGYCSKHNLPVDEINSNTDVANGNAGKPAAFLYVDDRGLQYRGQNAAALVEDIENFKPYWKQ